MALRYVTIQSKDDSKTIKYTKEVYKILKDEGITVFVLRGTENVMKVATDIATICRILENHGLDSMYEEAKRTLIDKGRYSVTVSKTENKGLTLLKVYSK